MPHNNPDNFPLLTWVWVVGLSVLGAIVRTITLPDRPLTGWALIRRLLANAIVSVFIAIITAALGLWGNVDFWAMVVFVGLTAHMGTPVLILLEDRLTDYIKNKKVV